MPNANTLYLELDKTGVSANNLVTHEEHTLPNTSIRLITPKFGAYYSDTVQVYYKNASDQFVPLVKNADYIPTEILHKTTAMMGAEVCTVILVTESNIHTTLYVSYQALGGHDQINRDNLFALLDRIQNPSETIDYYEIQNRPKAFQPGPHLQDALDIYGLEYIRDAINKLDTAIVITDRQTHQELIKQIDAEKSGLLNTGTDGVTQLVDTTMTLVNSAENALTITNDQLLKCADTLSSLVTQTTQLNNAIMDYKASNYNDLVANVANLLCNRNYDNSGPVVDVPAIIAPAERVLYLNSASYNAPIGVWIDQTTGAGGYTATGLNKPIKAPSSTNTAIEAVRFTTGKYLTRSSGIPVEISTDSTVFIVASPVPGTNHIKLNLFNDDNHKVSIDTSQYTALKVTDTGGSNTIYHGKMARTLGNKATVIVSTIAARDKDNVTLTSSPYRAGLTVSGVVSSTLDTDNIGLTAQRIGSSTDEQSADVFMVLVYNRLLSKTEIHAILTYIRTQYNTAVQYIENGDYTNWDVGFGSDLQNTIDFENRGVFGTAAVTDRAISIWDATNTYSQPDIISPIDIKIDSNPYLLVLAKNASKSFWRQTVELDVYCRHELKFSVVYGQVSLPVIRLRINGLEIGSTVTLDPSQSLVRDHVISFTPTTKINTIELFNLNTSTVGNCFGIGAMTLERKIYVN